jgi:hypothetical protein
LKKTRWFKLSLTIGQTTRQLVGQPSTNVRISHSRSFQVEDEDEAC